MIEKTSDQRPLCFIVVVWGEQFRNYMTSYTLRSLLAPGNLPCEIGRKKILLICGPREDWEALNVHPVAAEVRKHAELEWIEFEPVRHRQIRSMSIGLAMCLRRAKELNGYVSQFPPDSLYADNAVRQIGTYIADNLHLALNPAFRCEEDEILGCLDIDPGEHDPIVLDAQGLNLATIRSLHSQMLVTDIDAPYLFSHAHNFHLRGPQDEWLVSKNMAWGLALMDPSGVSDEHVDEAARSVLDSYIVAKMYPRDARIRFVTRSDEYAMISWAPKEWSAQPVSPKWYQRIPVLKRLYNDFAARKSLRYHLNWNKVEDDWIKRDAVRDVTVMYGDAERYDREMQAAASRLDELFRHSSPDLLGIGRKTAYMTALDTLNAVIRKGTFLYEALINRNDGRRRLFSRLLRSLPLKGSA